MPQFPFPEGDGFGGIAFHEVSCRRFVFVLGHDGDRYAEYGRLSGGGSLFEDGPRVTSASTRSTASPSSCPVPSLPCLPHRAEGSVCNELPSLQSAALVGFTRSAGRNDGWLGHSCGFRARAPLSMADNGCLLAAFAFAQFLGCFIQPVNPALHKLCSHMFMTRAADGLVLAAPFSNRVFQEFLLLLLHEAWATVFALSRVLSGSEQLFLRCKRTSIAHDVKIT